MATAAVSQSTTSNTSAASDRQHNSALIKKGETLILDLNTSDKQVYSFLQSAFSSEKTDPATLALLQQMLQKRMEKSGLLTNMIKMFGDAMMRIIGNIGR